MGRVGRGREPLLARCGGRVGEILEAVLRHPEPLVLVVAPGSVALPDPLEVRLRAPVSSDCSCAERQAACITSRHHVRSCAPAAIWVGTTPIFWKTWPTKPAMPNFSPCRSSVPWISSRNQPPICARQVVEGRMPAFHRSRLYRVRHLPRGRGGRADQGPAAHAFPPVSQPRCGQNATAGAAAKRRSRAGSPQAAHHPPRWVCLAAADPAL